MKESKSEGKGGGIKWRKKIRKMEKRERGNNIEGSTYICNDYVYIQ